MKDNKRGFTLIRTLDKSKNLDKVQPFYGFTLIETLVVIVIIALLITLMSNLFFSSIFGSSKTEALKEVRQNGEYAAKIIEETIKNSQELFPCVPGEVSVAGKDGVEITFKADLDQASGVSRIASISGSQKYYLTSTKVNVLSFDIDCSDPIPGTPQTVNLDFTIHKGVLFGPQEKKAIMTFSSNVTMRTPYQSRID